MQKRSISFTEDFFVDRSFIFALYSAGLVHFVGRIVEFTDTPAHDEL